MSGAGTRFSLGLADDDDLHAGGQGSGELRQRTPNHLRIAHHDFLEFETGARGRLRASA